MYTTHTLFTLFAIAAALTLNLAIAASIPPRGILDDLNPVNNKRSEIDAEIASDGEPLTDLGKFYISRKRLELNDAMERSSDDLGKYYIS
ncbi:unnamed protein product [Peniophora sp. CBMAI 1063]|nr:unnamed protein product [Peniophora sp. CBMAI 1063]